MLPYAHAALYVRRRHCCALLARCPPRLPAREGTDTFEAPNSTTRQHVNRVHGPSAGSSDDFCARRPRPLQRLPVVMHAHPLQVRQVQNRRAGCAVTARTTASPG
jgi:hypothetical protein